MRGGQLSPDGPDALQVPVVTAEEADGDLPVPPQLTAAGVTLPSAQIALPAGIVKEKGNWNTA